MGATTASSNDGFEAAAAAADVSEITRSAESMDDEMEKFEMGGCDQCFVRRAGARVQAM